MRGLTVLACFMACTTSAAAQPIVILEDTGTSHGALAVLRPHPAPEPFMSVLTRGYSARVLRLYAWAQRFAKGEGPVIEPAYLALTNNEGGFPRCGFMLGDIEKRGVPYIDLHRNSTLAGRPGAMDQIFPHELMHIVLHLVAGDPPPGHADQVHAIGVRTDRITAFDEGFAEHAQIMAIDDPGAVPETHALASDEALRRDVAARLAEYRGAMSSRWVFAAPARMTFPLWFSRSEQVLRYTAVRANAFARAPSLPGRVLTPGHAYEAYLLDSVLPGTAADPPRSLSRLLSTEGVISALFSRWVASETLRRVYRERGFYARFGTSPEQIDPIDNVYLKLFAAIHEGRYDAAAVVRAYVSLFPDEAAELTRITQDTFLTRTLAAPPEIWLENSRFTVGTTIFDQFRRIPRAHVFDLNAASPADLITIPGITAPLAAAIVASPPFTTIEDVRRVSGVTPQVIDELRGMERGAQTRLASETEDEAQLSLRAILNGYLIRALWALLSGWILAVIGYSLVRRLSGVRVALNGLGAALVTLLVAWASGQAAWGVLATMAVWGVPGGVWRLARVRSSRAALTTAAAWLSASIGPFLLAQPF